MRGSHVCGFRRTKLHADDDEPHHLTDAAIDAANEGGRHGHEARITAQPSGRHLARDVAATGPMNFRLQ